MRRAMPPTWCAIIVLCAVVATHPASAQDESGQEVRLPGASILALSPDGQLLAVRSADWSALCVYEVATLTERACGELDAHRMATWPDPLVWSPDSTRLAFAEDPFRESGDSDLWLMDAATGALTNLTDDGVAHELPTAPDQPGFDQPIPLDMLPTWHPDGQSLAFFRVTLHRDEFASTEIAQVQIATGQVETLVSFSAGDQGAVFAYDLTWTPDGRTLYYAVAAPDPAPENNGLWAYDAATGTTRRLLEIDPETGPPTLAAVDATGRTGLIFYLSLASGPAGLTSERDPYELIDLETGELTPVHPIAADPSSPTRVQLAIFSPDGTRVLYALERLADHAFRLLTRELPDGPIAAIATDLTFAFPLPAFSGRLFWATDGTVFARTDLDAGLLFHIESERASRSGAAPPSTAAHSGRTLPR